MKKQKILITGGAGGIGSVFVNSLGSEYEIDVVDNLNNGFLQNILNTSINFIEADISDSKTYDLLQDDYDCVFHLAAVSSLPFCENNKSLAIKYNVQGTLMLIEYCRKNGINNFCFGGTSAVYENNTEDIFTEDLNVYPDLIYPLSKMFCENILKSYIKNYNMSITILRFFNVFGPNQDVDRNNPPLLNYLIREYSSNRVPVLHSDGTQSRDYVYVKDLIPLFMNVINKPSKEIFNVCTGKLLSVNDILNSVSGYFNSDISEITWNNPKNLWDKHSELFEGQYSLNKERVAKETLKFSLGDNSKIFNYYGWKPRTNFVDLIEETIEDSIEILQRKS